MKKIILLGSVCFLSFAIPSSEAASPLKGLYGGIGLGLMTLDGTDSFDQVLGAPNPVSFDTDLSSDRLSYGLFVGYGRNVAGPLVVGGELYCDFARPQSSYRVFVPALIPAGAISPFGDNVQKHGSLGLAARIGVDVAKNVTPYVKLGVDFSGLTYTGLHYTQQRISEKKNMAGFAVAAGVDMTLAKHFLLRVEWTFTTYGSINFPSFIFNSPINPGGEARTNIQIKPRTQAFRLGFGYTF